MNKPKLFSNITDGTIVRFFRYRNSLEEYGLWTFGVVHRRQTHHFVVQPVGYPYLAEERFRYDGLADGYKDAPQIVFFLTPEEENHPLIREYRNIIKEQYKLKQKQLNLWVKIRDAANPLIFKNTSLPEPPQTSLPEPPQDWQSLTDEQKAITIEDNEIPF